jgi:Carboxypeptidase regulatory-like domain
MTATLVAFVVLTLTTSVRQQPSAGVKTYSVSGRVIDGTTGGSIADTVVVIWERLRERASGRRIPSSNGTFVIPNVTPGSYIMAAEVPGGRFSYRTETVDFEVRDRDVTGLGLIITPLGPRATSVTGRFVMENGGTLPTSLTRITAAGESSAIQRDGSFQLRLRTEEKYPIHLEGLPEGTYVKAVSAGFWNPEAETLLFSSAPPATLQITLAVGDRTVRGRVIDASGAVPRSEVTVSIFRPPSTHPFRSVSVGADGTFEIDRLRAGDYELKAKMGSGLATQIARLLLTVGNQSPSGVQMILKGTKPQQGHVVIEGAGRLEELQRFQPMIEVTDVLGVHRVPIRLDGTFEFQSFEGDYLVAIRDVPLGYEKFITVTGSTVEVRLRVVQGDGPRFFRPLQPK